MKIRITLINVLLFLIIVLTNCIFSQVNEENEFVDELIIKMTLNEKVGQLTQFAGTSQKRESLIRDGRVGSFLGVRGADEVNRLQKMAVEESRLGIPLIIGHDVIHGYNTTFPIPLAEAASWNPELVRKASEVAAFEAASTGIHWTFAPMVDIARDPRWGRIAEGSGEDPFLGSVMATARVKGFQGNDLRAKTTIAACAKHYVAYGGAEAGKDYNTVDISERVLREIYLPPFKSAVDEGVATIMSAFNDLNGIPASANHFTLTDILRGEWGFDGFVVSDWEAIGELVNHRFAKDRREAALKGLTAGVDMDMIGDSVIGYVYPNNLNELVNEGVLSGEILDEAVRRVLRIKYRLGLFDNPYVDKKYYEEHPIPQVEKNEVALNIARESIVLLKNENNLLPLSKNVKSIAVIGPLADNPHHPLGPWNAAPILENVVTPLQGLKNKLSPSTKIYFEKGCDIEGNNTEDFDDALEIASKSDITIMFMGEAREMSGEAASRTNIGLPGVQQELVKTIMETTSSVVVVLLNGRPLTLSWLSSNVPSILEAWFLGDQTGNAIADVLFGDFNPSGKLPVTFPRAVGQIPIYYNHKSTGRPFNDEDKYTSKYLDSPVTPLYPFGYGLSYSEFRYQNITANPVRAEMGDTIQVSIEVENVSDIAGQEVVQLYIRDRFACVTRPVKELKGFEKIYLASGEKKKIEFFITPELLSFYDVDMNKIVEPGTFDVMIGGNSEDVLSASFELYK